MQGIHDITILADNVQELRTFYLKVGFEIVFDKGEDMVVFSAGKNEFVIHKSPNKPTAVVGVSFAVADLEQVQNHLRVVGVAFDGPKPVRPGFTGISLSDPNGNRLELLSRG